MLTTPQSLCEKTLLAPTFPGALMLWDYHPPPPNLTYDALLWVLCALTFILGHQAGNFFTPWKLTAVCTCKNKQRSRNNVFQPSTIFPIHFSDFFEQTPAIDEVEERDFCLFFQLGPGDENKQRVPTQKKSGSSTQILSKGYDMRCWIHPERLTWNLQITHFERKIIFQTSMIMFHVNLPGCMFPKKVGRPVLEFRQAAELSLGGFLLSTKAVGAYPNPWRFWNTTGRVGEVCR